MYKGVGAASQAKFYEAIHQELAPLARKFEAENASLKTIGYVSQEKYLNASLALLQTVSNYIAHLQQHPMNRDMIEKIQNYLADPNFYIERTLAAQARLPVRVGRNATPDSRLVITVEVENNTVKITAPPFGYGSVDDALLLRRLRNTEKVELRFKRNDES